MRPPEMVDSSDKNKKERIWKEGSIDLQGNQDNKLDLIYGK